MASARVVYRPNAINDLLDSSDGAVAKEILKTAIKVEGAAKRLSPVDTGRLRSSIHHEIGRDYLGPFAIVGTDVNYGIYVELGTRYARAQPFLRPALYQVAGF